MKRIENKKGNGIIFRNSNGKICFLNRNSKYYEYIKNWDVGTEVDDYYFKVTKEDKRYNIVDIDETRDILTSEELMEEPVEEIIGWNFFEGEEVVETEYEPVKVHKEVIKYRTYDYKYVIGLDIVKGKEVGGWKRVDEIVEKEMDLKEPVRYKWSSIRKYIEDQFKLVEISSYTFKRLHMSTGWYISDHSYNADIPVIYIDFIYKMHKRVSVYGGKLEDILAYDRYLDKLKYSKTLNYAPEDIKAKFESDKEKLYKEAGAYKKWDSISKEEKWFISINVSESNDGYRRERTIAREANDDIIFKKLYPEEYEKASLAKTKDEMSNISELRSRLKEINILDLSRANIIDDE